jgi:single stranded DNA-binding protein
MLEAAASGVLAQPIELRTSKAGRSYANLSLAIDGGHDENDKPVTTWLRAAVFGETAELLARTATKGCKIYCEGALSLNSWTASDGTQKTGLSMACWKAEKIGASAIGRNRKRNADTFKDGAERQRGAAVAAESFRQPGSQAAYQLRATSFETEPHTRPRPKIQGLNDDLPW